ncbi:MAG: crossover junction endodeoxyribonuclease RuvC [Elusimicrobiota bacterium]
MIVLGIDPGTATTGWGIIKCEKGFDPKPIAYGYISTGAEHPFPRRLNRIHDELTKIITEFKPSDIAIEELFFAKNVKTAIKVGHARGVMLLTAEKAGVAVYEYTPLQIKQAIVGYGRAEKNQVQYMVTKLLNLKKTPKPDDTADALAVALCHNNMQKWNKRRQGMNEK